MRNGARLRSISTLPAGKTLSTASPRSRARAASSAIWTCGSLAPVRSDCCTVTKTSRQMMVETAAKARERREISRIEGILGLRLRCTLCYKVHYQTECCQLPAFSSGLPPQILEPNHVLLLLIVQRQPHRPKPLPDRHHRRLVKDRILVVRPLQPVIRD